VQQRIHRLDTIKGGGYVVGEAEAAGAQVGGQGREGRGGAEGGHGRASWVTEGGIAYPAISCHNTSVGNTS
jgi:hypothetical protein